MTNFAQIPHGVAAAIEEQAAANFLATFHRPIKVHSDTVMEAGRSRVVFTFTLAKPGLLPSALERKWFDGFVDGYRCACQVMLWLASPPEQPAAPKDPTND